jgi:hypothetical protein
MGLHFAYPKPLFLEALCAPLQTWVLLFFVFLHFFTFPAHAPQPCPPSQRAVLAAFLRSDSAYLFVHYCRLTDAAGGSVAVSPAKSAPPWTPSEPAARASVAAQRVSQPPVSASAKPSSPPCAAASGKPSPSLRRAPVLPLTTRPSPPPVSRVPEVALDQEPGLALLRTSPRPVSFADEVPRRPRSRR